MLAPPGGGPGTGLRRALTGAGAPAMLSTMRPASPAALSTALALAFALLAHLHPAAARAEDPPKFLVEVGQTKSLGGSAPICDDLSVVTVTLGHVAFVTGLKPGTTLCSVAMGGAGGARRVFQVVVTPPDPKAPGGQAQSERK